jgi:hypothetical protein
MNSYGRIYKYEKYTHHLTVKRLPTWLLGREIMMEDKKQEERKWQM